MQADIRLINHDLWVRILSKMSGKKSTVRNTSDGNCHIELKPRDQRMPTSL